MANCEASALQEQVQERQVTNKTEKLIKHKDNNHFIINMYAIHNATLLRKSLPQYLTAPRALHQGRQLHHVKVATGLRINQTAKRARAQEKCKETQARNAEKKRKRQEAMDSDDDEVENGEEGGNDDREPPAKQLGRQIDRSRKT